MITMQSERASEKSTFVITCAFTDEAGAAVIPKTLTWTLTDTDGNAVNERRAVQVESLAASVAIVLSGDDLQVLNSDTLHKDHAGAARYALRYFSVSATYDSDNGLGLPLKAETVFKLENSISVA